MLKPKVKTGVTGSAWATQLAAAFLVLSFLGGCSENPFFGEDINSTGKLTISGKINIHDAQTDDGVFIWLEGLGSHTTSNPDGSFELKIAEAQLQSGGGLTGFYKIYYYLSNYRIRTSDVFLYRGQVEYGYGDIDANGKVLNTVQLSRLLSIETRIDPAAFEIDFTGQFKVYVNLRCEVDSVLVETYKTTTNELGYVLARDANVADPQSYVISQNSFFVREVIYSATTWYMEVPWQNGALPAGEYDIIPFVAARQPGLPEGLVAHFESILNPPTKKYADFPVKLRPARLHIY